MKSLVLSGGSIKGAFQAGAIKAVLETGWTPDIITGISVGSLNGAFLTNAVAEKTDWKWAGDSLVNFWKDRIKRPSDIIIKKSAIKIGWDILWGKFDGIVSVEPLRKLINQTISLDNLKISPVLYRVGYVNLRTGNITYEGNFISSTEIILASTAIPFQMPLIYGKYADGGLIDNAPLREAISSGVNEIIVIATMPYKLKYSNENYGNVFNYSNRIMDIVVNNTLNDDLEYAELINKFCPDDGSPCTKEPFVGKKKLKIKVIRPYQQINVDIDNFTEKDISEMIYNGYETAKKYLAE